MKNNFIKRAITGILFVAVLVGGVLYHPFSFGALFAIITALCVYEFATLSNQIEGVKVNRLMATLSGVYLFLAFMGFCMDSTNSNIFIPYLALLIYLIISELYLKQENPVNNWAYTALSQVYVALPFALLNITAFHYNEQDNVVDYNAVLPLSILVFSWLSDTGAYCAGSLFGKHRLFERISPKKSWEGSVGGGVIALVSAFVFARFFPFLSTVEWLGLALVVVVFGTWGDLSESLFKRTLQIKDSGHILPGHGGMLDRFDGLLLSIPAAVLYLYIIS